MKRLITTVMILAMSILSANAAEKQLNTLKEIQVDSLRDTYNITLTTSSEVDVKRTIQSSDNMILTLRNIKPAKSLNTIYKNSVEVDSIMVEPVGNDVLNISIKANNISNSAVVVDAEQTETLSKGAVVTPRKQKKSHKQSIELAAPVNAYMPVYNNNIEEDEFDMPFSGTGLLAKIKKILTSGNNTNILTMGLIGLILFCGIKLFKKEEPETVIGLTQSLKEREANLYKDLSMNNSLFGNTLEQHPQIPSFAPKEMAPQARPQINANAGYGLRAYQSSSRNPYMSADNTMMQKQSAPSMNLTAQKQTVAPQQRTVSTIGSRVNTQSNITKPIQSMSNTALKPSNVDSMKFLDSMAKIYEKNGRSDLAKGLKAGMLKAKAEI